MKEYYIWESRCPDNHFRDPQQREQIIVAASHIDDALTILKWNNIPISGFAWVPIPGKDAVQAGEVPTYLFAGTRPITDESIDYADFAGYESDLNRRSTYHSYPLDGITHGKYNENIVIRRVTNCPLVA